jgi:hypothetical protein
MKKLFLLFLLALVPVLGQAQVTTGFHRTNQLLARSPQGVTANVVPNGTIYVVSTATNTPATIYSDPLLTIPIANSIVTTDTNGNYGYYAPLNYCVTEQVSSAGQGAYSIPNICQQSGSGTPVGTLSDVQYHGSGSSFAGNGNFTTDGAGNVTLAGILAAASASFSGSISALNGTFTGTGTFGAVVANGANSFGSITLAGALALVTTPLPEPGQIQQWRQTYGTGYQSQGVGFAVGGTSAPVSPCFNPSGSVTLSTFANRENCTQTITNTAQPPVVTTANTTFTATSVTSADFTAVIAANDVPVGMLIDTDTSCYSGGVRCTGVVTSASGSTINVNQWVRVDSSNATQTPTNGETVTVNPLTTIFGQNIVMTLSSSAPLAIQAYGQEIDVNDVPGYGNSIGSYVHNVNPSNPMFQGFAVEGGTGGISQGYSSDNTTVGYLATSNSTVGFSAQPTLGASGKGFRLHNNTTDQWYIDSYGTEHFGPSSGNNQNSITVAYPTGATGFPFDYTLNSVELARIGAAGQYLGTAFEGLGGIGYGAFTPGTSGGAPAFISRNEADAVPVVQFLNANAGSTGDIAQFRNPTTKVAFVDYLGNFTAQTVNLPSARKGTFTCTSGGSIAVSNTNYLATSDVVITNNTPGGTVSWKPNIKASTPGTSFTVICATSDTSVYNYDILN